MADILFGQAYFLRFDPKLWDARQPYPPLGALYAAACVREHGHDVAVFDAMLAESEAEWALALDRERPRVAVIYEDSFNYLSKMCLLRMRQAALTMIEAATARGIVTIVSGSDASDRPTIYLQRGARAVIRGEGEATLVDLVNRLCEAPDPSLNEIPGLFFLNANGHLEQTPSRPFIRDLDTLPMPAWDLIDISRYRETWLASHGYFSMNLVTTRGCPYHCNWCAKPIYGQRYAVRSPEKVAEEVSYLKRTFAPDHLWFADDIFGLKPGWTEAFATAVREREAIVPFKCLVRADQVTPRVADALRAAGCVTTWMGAESGSQRVLDAMEKGISVGQVGSATRCLRQVGIEVGFFLQFGYPGEARPDIEDTLRMVRACAPDDIGVSVSYPLPGTPFYERVRAELGTKQNWVDSDDLAIMYRATYPPDFYRVLHRLVHAEFRARRSMRVVAGRDAARPGVAARARHAATLVRDTIVAVLARRRLDALAEARLPGPKPLPLPVLSPNAAAVPSEQVH